MTQFKTWSQESLADFASDAFKRIKEQDDAIEQLRKDLSDAMKLLRELNRQKNEFVFCAECGADGGHALYCVACAEKFIAQTETKDEPVATVISESGANVTHSWWHEPALPIGTKLYIKENT